MSDHTLNYDPFKKNVHCFRNEGNTLKALHVGMAQLPDPNKDFFKKQMLLYM